MPQLGDVDFTLVSRPGAPHEPVDALASAIMSRPVQQV
jgi:hypothetical protein